jgi:hypothetical protein
MVLDTAHLRAGLFPGLETRDLERRSLYEILRSDYGRIPAEAQETLEPVILTPHECQRLGVPPHTTALLTRRLTTDEQGIVVALGHVLLRGDRSRYLFRRTVDGASLAPTGVEPGDPHKGDRAADAPTIPATTLSTAPTAASTTSTAASTTPAIPATDTRRRTA